MASPAKKEAGLSTVAVSKPKPNYTWYYIGIIFTATLGNASLGLQHFAPDVRLGLIAVAVVYSLMLTLYTSLSIAFGITFILVVIWTPLAIALPHYMKASGSANLAPLALVLGVVGSVLYAAALLMWIGIIFYGVAKGIGKLRQRRWN